MVGPPVGLSVPAHPVRLAFRIMHWRSGMTNSHYRWVIVAAGGLLGCVAIGGMFSLPVFLQPIARDTGWSVTGVSSAMTIGFLAMALTSMIWGTLSDRLGPLPVVLTGSVVLAGNPALASPARALVAFQFIFGWLVRHPSESCGVAGFGGHGHSADDHGAAGRLAGLKS